jgi:hypothetical protein
MNTSELKEMISQELKESGIISEQYIEHPFRVKPKEIEAFLKKYPQVEKSMKPFVSARIMQGYRKWLNWKNKNEDKLGGTPKHMSSPSFGEKTFYNHDFGNIQGWAAIFQYITAKQLKDPSLYSSKNESINETTKADIDKQKAELLKKVNVLVDKKKKLYSKVDISSPMSADEKKLDKEIADLFSQINDLTRQKRKLSEGKFAEKVKKAELAHSKGNSKLAKYHLDNAQTFMYGLASTEIGKNKEYLNKYNEMRKIYKESVNESKKSFKIKMYGPNMKSKSSDDVVQLISNKLKIDRGTYDGSKRFDELERQVNQQYDANKRDITFNINLKESVTESNNTPMMSKSGKDIFVDTTFVQLSNKFGTLEHIWMGDFVVKTKDGDVEFSRANKQIDGFSGRVHKVYGDPKAIASLIKNMKPTVVKESVNEASRRATNFYGDSKHGKVLHSLLKGKWDSKKVEKFLEKLGDGNDVKYARLIDFISGSAGLNIRKYKTVGEQLPELMKVLETLYTDFLTESITEEKTQKDLAKEINKKFGGTYRIQGYNLNIKGANASAETIKDFIEDLNKKHNLGYKRFFVKDKGSRKILGSVPFGIAITIDESITEGKYSNRADAMNAFFKGKISGKELDDIAKNDFNGAIATKGELTQFLKNSFMQDVMADQYSIPKSTLVKKVKELLPMVETNTTPNQTMFESVVDDNGMQRAVVALSESKKVDWKDFYTRAKDTSGYDPSFEKKYGRLLDLPHITDALNKTSDFKSFMKFISKFESVVDVDGMQRAGVALPQTEEEPIEESTADPKIITQLRDVVKNGYKKLKDPKSGKVMTVDSYSASAIVKVYDALNPTNKEKFSNAGLLGMQSMAFKLIK